MKDAFVALGAMKGPFIAPSVRKASFRTWPLLVARALEDL
jgi:hypothetical protein